MMPKLLSNRYMCPLVFQVPPPTLGIRVIGVNMIHGVPDKLNIYVKRVLEGSVAGLDGRIRVNDHIVEVRNEDRCCRSMYSLNPVQLPLQPATLRHWVIPPMAVRAILASVRRRRTARRIPNRIQMMF
jgi:hypothetical protein